VASSLTADGSIIRFKAAVPGSIRHENVRKVRRRTEETGSEADDGLIGKASRTQACNSLIHTEA